MSPDAVTVLSWFDWFYDMHVINKQKINVKSKWTWGTNLVPTFLCNLVPSAFSQRKGKSPGSDSLFQVIRLCGRCREGMSRKKQLLFLLFPPALSLRAAHRYLNVGASNRLLWGSLSRRGSSRIGGRLRDEPKECLRGSRVACSNLVDEVVVWRFLLLV